ncbi:hypothetical protein GCM10023185_23180 [Hymenobacter saemangeumensis]|uniref:Carboxypeptidase regulatory-like domain-containing protein n=1 Tax=Hymenobacter saemangeumensis TaxID=1084522 RepID=A0ABP8IG99_9BACT
MLTACAAPRPTLSQAPELPREYEVTRYKRRDLSGAPVLTGQVKLVQYQKLFTGVGICIWVDDDTKQNPERFHFTNEEGRYVRTLMPGTHLLKAGMIGINTAYVRDLTVEAGDSIRIDFCLRVQESASH